ncbi:MAG: urease accessory protein UreJ [Gammaproteobacteria bacterium]|nr:MAG: urease accessory protein UreJ [Gammaproteobacteria bacterium]
MKKIQFFGKYLALIFGLLLFNSAHAHGVQGGGLINGLMHPVFGPDHLLAMVAVGILSVQIGGKAIWTVPGAFLVFMLAGGILGINDIPFPAVETGIAASVLLLGIAIALAAKMPTLLAMLFVGAFGMFHGYAHGMEMPSVAEPALYATGFIVATAGLHIAGVLIGFISHYVPRGDIVLRFIGVVIAAVGLYILFALQ